MPRLPSYRLHKASGQAVVTLPLPDGTRRDYYLGVHNTTASQQEYLRLIQEWQAGLLQAHQAKGIGTHDLTIAEVINRFRLHAEAYYGDPDGRPTSEVHEFAYSSRPLRELFGHTLAREFGPKALTMVRQAMIDRGLCRQLINRRMRRVIHIFKWAAAEELAPVTVYQALRTVPGLKAGRTAARENPPVVPVPVEHYEATLPHLARIPRVIVELMRWTGMRSGEACRLRLADLDCSGPVWCYTPPRHKTAHHGKTRSVLLGKNAQQVIRRFLAGRTPAPVGMDVLDLSHPTARLHAAELMEAHHRPVDAALLRDLDRPVVWLEGSVIDPEAPLFSPRRDRDERFAAMRTTRKSKVQPSQVNRKRKKPRHLPRLMADPASICHAVRDACKAAGVPTWHPHQLRHLRATEIRREFGLEAAQVVLGHSQANITQLYAERDLSLARKVASELG